MMLVDDHRVVVQGLKALVDAEPDMQVVGSANDGSEAVAKAGQLKPNIILMDIRMKGSGGLQATSQIKELYPEIAIIVLTVYDADIYVAEAVRAGASGYVIKDSEPELLLKAIRRAASGDKVFPSGGQSEKCQSGVEALTPRELEVINLLAGGRTNKEIAGHLHVAEVTVKKHVQSLMKKMGASDRTQAAVLAVQLGLVE